MNQTLRELSLEIIRVYVKEKKEAEKLCSALLAEITVSSSSVFEEVTLYYHPYDSNKEKMDTHCVEIVARQTDKSALKVTINGKLLEEYGVVEVEKVSKEVEVVKMKTDVTVIQLEMDSTFSEEEETRLIGLLANARSFGGVLQNYYVRYQPKNITSSGHTIITVAVDNIRQDTMIETLNFYGTIHVTTHQHTIQKYYYRDKDYDYHDRVLMTQIDE